MFYFDWSFVNILLFLCFCFYFSCLTYNLIISCFCFCFCFSCLIYNLIISCFFFFCLKLTVIDVIINEVKNSEFKYSKSLIFLFHSFVCWTEIITTHFQVEEDFKVKSSEFKCSKKLIFFCHIFACWFSFLSLTIF